MISHLLKLFVRGVIERRADHMSYQLLPPRGTGDIPGPVSTKTSSSAHLSPRLRVLVFFGTAAFSGILFHLLLIDFHSGNAHPGLPGPRDWWNTGGAPSSPAIDVAPPVHNTDVSSICAANITTPYIRPGLGHHVEPDEEDWSLERIREMVSKTKGYYARDYSLGLGWNNASSIVLCLAGPMLTQLCFQLPDEIYLRS